MRSLLPPLHDKLADVLGVQPSFLVPLVACPCVAFHGLAGHGIGRGRESELAAPC